MTTEREPLDQPHSEPGPFESAEVSEWIPPPPPPPRPRFQHRYRTHIILFLLTLVTMAFRGDLLIIVELLIRRIPLPISPWDVFVGGLSYALPMLAILGAHEFGHYFYCRRHNVDATLPYFLPVPLPLTGTIGAVIRIREAFPSMRALFDIGVAGPIAGFVVLLPFLVLGLMTSQVRAVADFPQDGMIQLGEPLLLKAASWLWFGPIPEGHDVIVSNVGFAAWFGMFATALNLLPFGQLDGGHIAYAVLGRHAGKVSLATLAATIALTFFSLSWLITAAMMVVMALVLGVRHPPIQHEDVPIDRRRRWIALFALVIFILCFTPVPIQIFQD